MKLFLRFTVCLVVMMGWSHPGFSADPAGGTEVVLTRRAGDGPYGTCAYSFRLASQDLAIHRNYVDLVFNNCGQLHINPVNGMESRIADLGPTSLEAAKSPVAGTKWHQESILPQSGHVYWQEVKDERQDFTVRFLVTEAAGDTVKLRWQAVDPTHKTLPLSPGKGAAGKMGSCGGSHAEE